MPDDRTKAAGQDLLSINVNEDYELRSWSEKFGCNHDKLRAAVKAVGVMAKDVEAHLKSRQ